MPVAKLETKLAFEVALKDAGKELVVVDFFATWCGPCKRLAPQIDKLAEKHPKVHFYKVDVEKLDTVAHKYKVQAMPTILFFKNGAVVSTVVGASIDKIKESISTHQ